MLSENFSLLRLVCTLFIMSALNPTSAWCVSLVVDFLSLCVRVMSAPSHQVRVPWMHFPRVLSALSITCLHHHPQTYVCAS